VFAFTQVTTLLANDPTFAGIGRGVLVLAALWWPWTAYAWLTNTVDPEEGFVGAALFVALTAMTQRRHSPVLSRGRFSSDIPARWPRRA
jgi:low temperature requirement protein LtrA